MDSIHDLAPEIQKRIDGFGGILRDEGFSRPEVKNVTGMLYGMLKSPGVHVSGMVRALGEPITPKKTWERLSRNLRREGLWERLTAANIRRKRRKVRGKRYCIIDVSDIQKPEAVKMEGLSRVRDGDGSGGGDRVIGSGYWWLNGVMADGSGIVPVYSEIYSLDYEGRVSENGKIIRVTEMVHEVHPEAVYVLDRGGDRSVIFAALLDGGKRFVVRCQGQRSLRLHSDSGKETNIEETARRTKPSCRWKSLRNGEVFEVGLRRVYLGENPLWLVVSRRSRGGMSWYLTNVEGSRRAVMETVMEAYGLRWRVEEYHRQVKQDYNLEGIRLRTYGAIKNMAALVMVAASFCALLPENLVIKLLVSSLRLPRRRLSDIPCYPYYMITAAVARALEHAVKRRPIPLGIRKRNCLQLNLQLKGS